MSSAYTGKSIAIASSTNASPIVVTTGTAHGLANGDAVLITGHQGNFAANGPWTIGAVTATTFSLIGSTGTGVGTASGSVSTRPFQITIPSDGDVRDAASVNPGFEGLADLTSYILNGLTVTPRVKIPNQYITPAYLGGFIQNRIVEVTMTSISSNNWGVDSALISTSSGSKVYSLTGTFQNDSKPGDLMILIGSIRMTQGGGGGGGIGFFSYKESGVRTDFSACMTLGAGAVVNEAQSATVFRIAPMAGGTSPTFEWGVQATGSVTTQLLAGSQIIGILLRP